MAFNIPNGAFKLSAADMGTPDYVSALSRGMDLGNKPAKLSEELLGQQLTNAMNRVKAKYAEPMAQAQLSHQNALIQKALRGPAPNLSNLEKAMAGAERIKQQFGADSPQAKVADAYLQKISQGSGGISIGTDPDTGMPLVQIGGTGTRGGGGKLFQSSSGDILSQPTGITASNLQGRVVGADTVEPFIKEITENLPQFQNPTTKGLGYAQGLSNALLGTNYSLPSEKATGKSAILEASEGMLKSFGLNATGENRRAMEEILTPKFGESREGYENRVKKQASAFSENKNYAKQALRHGINVSQQNNSNAKRLKFNISTGRLE